MAHIPQGDTEELWNQAPHNWHGLHQNLERRIGTSHGIDNNLVEDMIQISKDMEGSGQPYPPNADKLNELLNQKLHAAPLNKPR